ncbi:Flp pilus assembly protein TadD [Aliiruegeria haliotis]|uniref:Flp pilus assembly protein TadD n=1 Tax=Aliiruegeria haliotis TaxID=1280846 RepID=A0A2T0RF71_9RHOB|nr:tetratricopeptide repeat protein [Aliiruegeria haliotis]PRY19846.1 Flp pilus assembly protein TadD [Aliiruegeria haliotis]
MNFKSVRRLRNAAILLCATVTLAACDSAEDRAEEHFQNALELMEQGDVERAYVELRNVFKLNGKHREARTLYADHLREIDDPVEAISHYRLLVEQYPDDISSHVAIAEIAINFNEWVLVEDKVAELDDLGATGPEVDALRLVLKYRAAVQAQDADARRAVAEEAAALKAEIPDNEVNRAIIIDNLLLDGENEAALVEINEALALIPTNRQFHQLRLQALGRAGDRDGMEQALLQMIEQFPDEASLSTALVRLYSSEGQTQKAEDFLRGRIVHDVANDENRTALVLYLAATKGSDAALKQAESFVEEGTNDDYFRTLTATIKFENGQTDEAIAEVENVLTGAEDGEQTNRIKVALAEMLLKTGNEVGARSQIEGVLENDPTMVDALRMRAEWLIRSDRADQAILDLRTALDQDPDNVPVLSLMAQAHLRNGDRDLAAETLSLATAASNNAPAESLAQARHLIANSRFIPAETVLIDSLRLAPNHPELLAELGMLYVRMEDWPRAEQVENTLRDLDTPGSKATADQIRLAILRVRQQGDAAIAFLEGLAEEQGGQLGTSVEILRSHIAQGNTDAAREHVDDLLSQAPNDPTLRYLSAAVDVAGGDFSAAETTYRDLLAENPGFDRAWMELVRILNMTGRSEEAEQAVADGLTAVPGSPQLLWAQATIHERNREFDAAIDIYETLYERNTGSVLVANNLASLLSTVRQDDESLERAYRIARRLRETDLPPYQDTYGWIAYRRGEFDDALRHLEPAAKGLPEDPLVQYHLALTYMALEQNAKALEQFQKTLDVARDDPRPAFDDAREKVKMLQSQ